MDAIFAEHRALRSMLVRIDRVVERFEAGDRTAAEALRQHACGLYARFAAHLVMEDRVLLPALRARGQDRLADALVQEHLEQRELLGFLLGRLAQSQRPALLLARELRQFGALLREDMEEEERALGIHVAPGPSVHLVC